MKKNSQINKIIYSLTFLNCYVTFLYFLIQSLFIRKVWITKTGEPWRFSVTRESAKPPFEPFVQMCEIFRINSDGSIDVMFIDNKLCLSNGNGMTCSSSFYRLEQDGTVKYWEIYNLGIRGSYYNISNDVIKSHILNGTIGIKEWHHNKPLWSWSNNFSDVVIKNNANIINQCDNIKY